MPDNADKHDLLHTVLRTAFETLPTFLDLFQLFFIKQVLYS